MCSCISGNVGYINWLKKLSDELTSTFLKVVRMNNMESDIIKRAKCRIVCSLAVFCNMDIAYFNLYLKCH